MSTVNYIGGLFEDWISGGSHTYKNFIATPSGIVAMLTQSPSTSDQLEYFTHDNLGSIDTVTTSSGSLVQKLAYDVFGNRQATNWQGPAGTSFATDWGYTGHLMIDALNLIHMGGRVYDPTIGRFLSPDPTIQAPGNLQNWNRYSYVLNNPLTLTDPSGFNFFSSLWHDVTHNIRTIAAIAVGIAITVLAPEAWGVYAYALGGFASGMIASNGNLQAGLIGAVTAAAFYGVGQYFDGLEDDALCTVNGNTDAIEVGRIAAHGVIGGLSSEASGGSFGAGALSTLVPDIGGRGLTDVLGKQGYMASLIEHGVLGGTAAALGGGKFGNGALTASFSYAFNDAVQEAKKAYVEAKIMDLLTVGVDTDGDIKAKIDISKSFQIDLTKDQFKITQGSNQVVFDDTGNAVSIGRFFETAEFSKLSGTIQPLGGGNFTFTGSYTYSAYALFSVTAGASYTGNVITGPMNLNGFVFKAATALSPAGVNARVCSGVGDGC